MSKTQVKRISVQIAENWPRNEDGLPKTMDQMTPEDRERVMKLMTDKIRKELFGETIQ